MKVPVEHGRACEDLAILLAALAVLVLVCGLVRISVSGEIISLRDVTWTGAMLAFGIGHFVAGGLAHRARKKP